MGSDGWLSGLKHRVANPARWYPLPPKVRILLRPLHAWRRRFSPCDHLERGHHFDHIGRELVCRRCSGDVPYIRFTRHATDRWIDRVDPAASPASALRAMVRARRRGAEFTFERPEWVRTADDSDAYLIVDDVTCVPLVPTEDCWLGVTTLTRWNLKRMDDFKRGQRMSLSELRTAS